MKKILSVILGLAGIAHSATVSVDDSGVGTNIGATAAASQGYVRLNPAGVLGWANWGAGLLVPAAGEFGGDVALALGQVGEFTLNTANDNRFGQQWGETTGAGDADTVAVRGLSGSGLGDGEGFKISFTPGAVGSYDLHVHVGEFDAANLAYDVKVDGVSVGNGLLPAFAQSRLYDEGFVKFTLAADEAEAGLLWEVEILRTGGTGQALLVGGAYLLPTPGQALAIQPVINFTNNGAQASLSIPFTNSGAGESLVITSVTPTGFDGPLFTVDGFTSPVAPGESGTIELTFSPEGNGQYLAELEIASNDAGDPVKTITLSGTVTDPTISASATRVDFGNLPANPGEETTVLTLTNTGGGETLFIYDLVFIGQGDNRFTIISAPESIGPGESGDVVIGIDPGVDGGRFSDLLRIDSSALNTPTLTLPVVANVAFANGSQPITVTNGDFNDAGWNTLNGTLPVGWTSSLVGQSNVAGMYGQGAPATPNLTSIAAHFQSVAGTLEQNLSDANPGLDAAGAEAVTISFDHAYRNDAATNGPIMMRVSLLAGGLEVAGRDLLVENPGVAAGAAANPLTPVSFRMAYDNTGLEGQPLSVRISRAEPILPSNGWQATSIIDNVVISIDGEWVPSDSAYDQWADAAGLPEDNREPGDDFDGDGYTNFEEFAFGGTPDNAGSRTLVAMSLAETSGDSLDELILTLAVREDAVFSATPPSPGGAADGVSYGVQGSLDLSDFTSPVTGPLENAVVPASWSATAPAGYRYVSFRLDASNGLTGKGFLRAVATPAP